ncbi:hypothetical protein P7C71_g3667, partial [Lecanoromycetidae sp. Uapishka_2]
MAPVGEVYFPPLDSSWKTTYVTLSQTGDASDSGALRRHLTDPQTVNLLARSLSPSSAPTSQTKSSFETKTSSINVTPSSHARYDIKQVQDDTLWLSKETKIDEVSALRIAVLEWQTRSAAELLQGSSGDQITLTDGSRGVGQFQASIFDPGSSLLGKSTLAITGGRAFDEASVRRRRLLEIYLSERRYLLKSSEYITLGTLSRVENVPKDAVGLAQKSLSWLEDIGVTILSKWDIDVTGKVSPENFVIDAVRSMRSKLEALAEGSGWFQDQGALEDVEIAWCRNQLVELVHIMQILLNILESSSSLLKSPAILAWYRLMGECAFFENFQPPHPALEGAYDVPIQSLAALISLAIINIPLALDVLVQASASSTLTVTPKHPPYLLDSAAVNEMNEIFIGAAALKTSSPAVLAWGILMQSLRECALITRESREVRQSLRAADKFGAPDSSDTDGAERSATSRIGSLRRRSSTGSDTSQQSTLLEEIYDTVAIAGVDGDPIAYLANNAVDHGKVFEILEAIAIEYCTPFGFEHGGRSGQKMRGVLLDLIRVCLDFIEYQPALITATLAVLTGSERFWDILDRSTEHDKADPAARFLKDNLLRQKLFLNAQLRFPYESWPYLQFCRALTFENNGREGAEPAMWAILEELDTFSCLMPAEFYDYETVRTQEEIDYIRLTGDLTFNIGPSLEDSSSHMSVSNDVSRTFGHAIPTSKSHTIPRSTQGEIMNNAKPFVVAWRQEFSCLTYIGKVLQCASRSPELSPDLSNPSFSSEVIRNMISLITSLLLAATRGLSPEWTLTDAIELTQTMLGSLSDGLDRNQDVVSVIFDIFEKELYRPQKSSDDTDSMGTLIECLQFTYALLPLMPDRVWPFLGRSGLLGIGKDETQLSVIVTAHEIVLGRYEFLLGCIRLFDALLDDSVAHAVSRKAPSKSVTRFGNTQSLGAGVSQTTMERVLLNFTRIMIEVFESTMNWRFIVQEDRMEINFRLCSTFQKTLEFCFDVNDNPNLSQKLTSVLAPSAEYIINVFLSRSNNDVTVLPLLHILGEGIAISNTSLPTSCLQYRTSQVKAAVDLITVLIRVNRLLGNAQTHLEEQMFKATSMLAKVYAAQQSFKLPVVELFDALVRSAVATGQQPPSLLGHLGQETASHFLEVLSMLDQPLDNDILSSAIWRLLSAVVSNRQQWFAIFVLTGTTPRETFKDKTNPIESGTRRSEPILNIALDALSNLEKLDSQKALAMLEFVALAADFWPWVLATMEKHSNFLKAISEYAAHIGSTAAASREKSHKTSADYNSMQKASYVVDILSMYTHYTQQTGNQKFAKGLVPHLTYLIKNAIAAPSYNASLQANLRQNFELKFSGCILTDFKRTSFVKPLLGDSFYYHLGLANKMLAYEPAWVGRKGQGFAEELRRANSNLSVVEAQVNLFHSWKSLLVELSGPLASEPKYQRIMAVAVKDCLKTNAENNLPEAIFERLAQSRADLAFTLMQRLLETKSTEAEVKNILPVAWHTLRRKNPNLGSALSGDDADYYRVLLKILYLSLQTHTLRSAPPAENLKASGSDRASTQRWSSTPGSIVHIGLEILTSIVAQGFRSLTIILHDTPKLVRPSDFSLITAILRTILRIPDLSRNTTHLLTAFSDAQTARCASTLLSWSDQLATSGDPIYGELSILFLLEMSSVPTLAESLAVEGVFTHILSTNLIRLLQSRSFGPFDQPMRMYIVWAKGLLPLLLNLLTGLGPPLGAEVAAALNHFPHQLTRASSAFASSTRDDANADHITLTTASEAQSLSLITTILQTFREAGASASVTATQIEDVQWDRAQVKEDVESWLQTRETLRERIVPSSEREEAWTRAKPIQADGQNENRLEEKVVEEMRAIVEILKSPSMEE